MKEILVVAFLLTYRKHLIMLNMILFLSKLEHYDLNLISQTKTNMSQLMVMILILLM